MCGFIINGRTLCAPTFVNNKIVAHYYGRLVKFALQILLGVLQTLNSI